MIRRDFLSKVARLILTQDPKWHGWLPGHFTRKASLSRHLYRFGSDKVARLWEPYQEVTGNSWLAHSQEGPDCVAQATGGGMDLLTCKQIAMGKSEKWITKSSTNVIYAGGRNLIGHDTNGGGMMGEWAVKYLTDFGNLLRKKYLPHDLTEYSKETLKYWDKKSIPVELQEEAKKHPLLNYTPVRSYAEGRDLIAAGYPIVFCASMGADDSRRDKDGFINPRGRWLHAWLAAGVDDMYHRPGICLLNSHTPFWGSGPKRHGQPDGSCWIDAEVFDKHCRQFQDSYALTSFKGFPKPEYVLW